MKKIAFAFMGILFIVKAHSQTNTFPTSGNVGIGIISPGAKLHVVSGEPEGWAAAFINSNGAGSYFGYGSSNGAFINAGPNASSSSYALNVNKAGNPLFYVQGDGYVGIGTSSPFAKLDIQSNTNARFLFSSSAADKPMLTFGDINGNPQYGIIRTYDLTITDGTNNFLKVIHSGNIGIGTSTPAEKLSVIGNISASGNITTRKITVTQSGWSDYVFYDNYHLRTLPELEKFINKNKHLPDVPSAKDVEEKGINVGDTQALLLKKVEELTLYIIKMDKEKQGLISRLEEVERKIKRK